MNSWERIGSTRRCRRFLNTLSAHKQVVAPPLVLLVLVVGLCVFGVLHATDAVIATQRQLSKSTAEATADAIKLQINVVSGTLRTMAAFIAAGPDWNRLLEDLPMTTAIVADQAARRGDLQISGQVYMPFGVQTVIYPEDSPLRIRLGVDTFAPEFRDRLGTVDFLRQRTASFSGPITPDGLPPTIIARYSVFVPDTDEDESWNNPNNMTQPSFCPPGLCYNSTTREKFWGFVGTFVLAGPLFEGENSRFSLLRESNYGYRLSRKGNAINSEESIVEHGVPDGKASADIDITLPGISWRLEVWNPEISRNEDVSKGVVAMIVVVAVIISGLLLLYFVSCKEVLQLYVEQKAANCELGRTNDYLAEAQRVLEAEKQQREVLLERQMKLISCFEKTSCRSSKSLSKHRTLEQIAEARGNMAEQNVQGADEDNVQILELMGEGSFGKVYKGLWRRTLVAIKVMLLTSNICDVEKRESMVIWEAAISSSLLHPNIVKTYTYSIKPVKQSASYEEDPEIQALGSAVKFSRSMAKGGSKTLNSAQACAEKGSGSVHCSLVHGIEVQLVLEYCDRGTLRDALDQGAFMSPAGLNYLAILDSAVDIARAMLHLHCNNVLHMDLKARNVLLASSGTEDRGVCCKVADFGLAVRMEQLETHMSGMNQGTVTHMSPEVLLEGRVSKAADVYAFGITMWELFTAGYAYKGVPKALLGHRVAEEKHRPPLPLLMPSEYKALLIKCWDHRPESRPTFALVLEELLAIREALPDTTVPLQPILSPRQVPRAKYRKVSRQLPRFGSKAALGSFGEHLQAETLEDVQDGQGSASKLEADAQFEDQQNA